MSNVETIIADIQAAGRAAEFFNINAADAVKRVKSVQAMVKAAGREGRVKVLLHSLAFGTLKPFIGPDSETTLTQSQIEMTLDVMASSLVYWSQDLYRAGLLKQGSQIFAMTSSGGHRQWQSYGAVSAAKAALESYVRQLAVELGPFGIAANAIQAGVADTPALRKIPGYEDMIAHALKMSPGGRLTRPEDIAQAVVLLGLSEESWLTGNVIRVDGGEDLVM